MNNAGKGFLKAVVIVGLFFIITYYLSYNKWLDHDFSSVDISYRVDDEENKANNNEKTIEYKSLYSNINYELLQYNFGEEFYDIYYNNKPFYDEYYIYVGVVNIIKNDIIVNCNLEKNITSQELKKEINKLFGNVDYTNKSFTTKNNKVSINYISSEDKYNIKVNGTCSGYDYSNGGIKNIFSKVEIKDNELYIYEKALYIESSMDQSGNIIFSYYNGLNNKSKLLTHSFDKVDVDSLATYVYKFININNQYTIKSINKVS